MSFVASTTRGRVISRLRLQQMISYDFNFDFSIPIAVLNRQDALLYFLCFSFSNIAEQQIALRRRLELHVAVELLTEVHTVISSSNLWH